MGLWDSIVSIGKKIGEGFSTVGKKLFDGAKSVGKKVFQPVSDFVSRNAGVIRHVTNAMSTGGGLLEKFGGPLGMIAGKALKAGAMIGDDIVDVNENIRSGNYNDIFGSIVGNTAKAVIPLGGFLKPYIKSGVADIQHSIFGTK